MEDYDRALEIYFGLKSKYETQNKREINKIIKDDKMSKSEKQRAIRDYKGKCVLCRRNVNTIFEQTETSYVAQCGSTDTTKCKLDIRITKPNVVIASDEMERINKEQEAINNNIRLLHLRTLFGKIDSTQLQKEHLELMTQKKETDELAKMLTEEYEKKNNLTEKAIKRKELTKKIYQQVELVRNKLKEYYEKRRILDETSSTMKTYERTVYKEIVDIHSDIIYPYVEELREINYDSVFIEEDNMRKLLIKIERIIENKEIYLDDYNIESLIYS